MPAKGFSIPVSCHPERRHVARGLCAACYQKWRRTPTDELVEIVSGHEQRKQTALITWEGRQPRRGLSRRGAYNRQATLKSRYGITPARYDELLAEQDGCCAICPAIHAPEKPLYVDHDHATGRVRGLLCPTCNTLVGFVENHPMRVLMAQAYLNKRS